MAWAFSVNAIPAIHYNKKIPETLGNFFIFISIGASNQTLRVKIIVQRNPILINLNLLMVYKNEGAIVLKSCFCSSRFANQ